jgi:6-phosphofructo-2-kinase/fructose-2,6-biphosphatase
MNYITLNQVGFLLQVYEPVEEGSYIKMIDMVKGEGGQLQVKQ